MSYNLISLTISALSIISLISPPEFYKVDIGKEIRPIKIEQVAPEYIFTPNNGASNQASKEIHTNLENLYIDQYENLKNAIMSQNPTYELKLNVAELTQEQILAVIKEIQGKIQTDSSLPGSLVLGDTDVYGSAVNGKCINVRLVFNFKYNKSAKQRNIESKIDEIVAQVNQKPTDEEKVKYINRYIVNNARYAYEEFAAGKTTLPSGLSIFDPFALLEDGRGVCAAYTKLFEIIASKAGLECKSIVGTADSTVGWISHSWNLVKIDGKWYHIDVTWNDTDLPDGYGMYDYFLIGNTDIAKDHKWNKTSTTFVSNIKYNGNTVYTKLN